MYTTKIKVPFISPSMITQVMELLPASAATLNTAVHLPLLDTPERAIDAATVQATKNIESAPYEYIKEVADVDLDEETRTWTVTLVISGD